MERRTRRGKGNTSAPTPTSLSKQEEKSQKVAVKKPAKALGSKQPSKAISPKAAAVKRVVTKKGAAALKPKAVSMNCFLMALDAKRLVGLSF